MWRFTTTKISSYKESGQRRRARIARRWRKSTRSAASMGTTTATSTSTSGTSLAEKLLPPVRRKATTRSLQSDPRRTPAAGSSSRTRRTTSRARRRATRSLTSRTHLTRRWVFLVCLLQVKSCVYQCKQTRGRVFVDNNSQFNKLGASSSFLSSSLFRPLSLERFCAAATSHFSDLIFARETNQQSFRETTQLINLLNQK